MRTGRKVTAVLLAALFLVSLAGMASAGNVKVVTGTIVKMDAERRILTVQDESEKLFTFQLTDGVKVDLAAFEKGDKVRVVVSGEGVVKSIEKIKS